MNSSIIQRLQLEETNRLDAEFYHPEFMELEMKLNILPTINTIEELSEKVFSGPFGSALKSGSYQESGIPFIRIGDIGESFIEQKNIMYISEKEHKRIHSTYLRSGDIVLSKIGTIGRLSIIPEEFQEVNISENNIGIRLNDDKDFNSYLFFFLLSKYGQYQILKRASGNVQLKLNVSDIGSIKVPIPSRKELLEFRVIFENILDLDKSSLGRFSKVENLLLKKLGLINFRVGEDLFFTTSLQDVNTANRMDGDYFLPKYKNLISRFDKTEKLSNLAKRKNGTFKSIQDQEYEYTEISDVNVGNSEVLSNKIVGSELPANAKIQVNGGELIISKVRPTRGAVGIIPEDWNEDHVVSGAFSVFDVKSPMKEYLQVVLRSIIGKLQMESPTTGTSYPIITDFNVENILIPVLPKSTQEKIAELVRKSHSSCKKAKDLLEEAKRMVEELIEGKTKNVKIHE